VGTGDSDPRVGFPTSIPTSILVSTCAGARLVSSLTYSEDYNFIIRYMPGRVHEMANIFWSTNLFPIALALLTAPPHEIGCFGIGLTSICLIDYMICVSEFISLPAYQLGSKKKQPDDGTQPNSNPSHLPSIVVEVGSSESLAQLKIDAKLWGEVRFREGLPPGLLPSVIPEYSAEVSQFVLHCHSLTRTSSDKACHPYFN
jgi:hypothetical protein